MTKTFALASIAALYAATAVAPLTAGEPTVVTGRAHAETVTFADLDLTRGRDRIALNARVMAAATRVCIAAEGRMNMNRVLGGAENTCPNRTYKAARPQVRAAVARAKAGQPSLALRLTAGDPAALR